MIISEINLEENEAAPNNIIMTDNREQNETSNNIIIMTDNRVQSETPNNIIIMTDDRGQNETPRNKRKYTEEKRKATSVYGTHEKKKATSVYGALEQLTSAKTFKKKQEHTYLQYKLDYKKQELERKREADLEAKQLYLLQKQKLENDIKLQEIIIEQEKVKLEKIRM